MDQCVVRDKRQINVCQRNVKKCAVLRVFQDYGWELHNWIINFFFFITATVHVTISEGQGVQDVGQTVQEYLNSADSYSICDAKGLAIADTSETKGI